MGNLIIEITKIYDDVDKKRKKYGENKEYDYSQLTHKVTNSVKIAIHSVFSLGLPTFFVFPLLGISILGLWGIGEISGSFFAGKKDKNDIVKIVEGIVDEYDNEYNKITIVDAYKLIADNLKKELEDIKKFLELLKKIKYWYDYDIIYDN